ncbi:type II toxin-antitoxin system RelE family toxin [Streptomyces avicenniae]|uniref:type II toxin-antitoxin system RelE family toxin n=1 Tax=Streptomyces avicenniae TaxID=500153 RepID=UPI00069C9610|nr:type II toxin-antitoxin system RelE/ParE family toxin [Streptomyces avicenniae]
MNRAKVQFAPDAERALARLYKSDPAGTDQVIDSINLLLRNPQPTGVHRWSGDQFRMRVGFYRVFYKIVSRKPVIISIEHVGRAPTL